MIILKKYITGSQVLRNIVSLSVVQIGNYLLPLITIPYLTRTLSPDKYGLITFAQVTIGYFTIFINFGFDLTATREISIHRNSREKVAEIFTHVLALKTILLVLSTCILAVLLSLDTFNANKSLYLYTHLINIGFVLFPAWLFQGLEKLGFTAILNFAIKLIFTICIFIFIRSSNDYLLCNAFLSISQILVGLVSIYIAFRYQKVYLTPVKTALLLQLFKGSSWIFLSTAIITIYTNTNIFLLGLLTTQEDVAFFNICYKIIFAIHGLVLLPFNLAFFPHITKIFNEDPGKAHRQLQRATGYLIAITLCCTAGLFLFAKPIVSIFGAEFIQASVVLKTLSLLPVIMSMINVFGFNGLVAMKQDKKFVFITGLGATISVALNLVLIPLYGIQGVAWTWLMSETVIFITAFVLYKRTIKTFKAAGSHA